LPPKYWRYCTAIVLPATIMGSWKPILDLSCRRTATLPSRAVQDEHEMMSERKWLGR
jgi:hypothetical protein